jgi:S-DNA-T family DNA segregation ATPase FtsK/SpoIIIE
MNDPRSQEHYLTSLNSDVIEAMRRRQRLKTWRSDVRASELLGQKQIEEFSDNSEGGLMPEHPLLGDLGEEAAGAFSELLQMAQIMCSARDEATSSRQEQAGLEGQLAKIRRRRGLQKGWGIACLVLAGILFFAEQWIPICAFLGVGIWLLVCGLEKSWINKLQSDLKIAQEKETEAKNRLRSAKHSGISATGALAQRSEQFFTHRLEEDARLWNEKWEKLPPFLRGDWSEAAWRGHDFKLACRLRFFLAGTIEERPEEGALPYTLPFLAPFLGTQKTVIVTGDPNTTLPWLHGALLQLAATLPYAATFTMLDPAGAGRAFPMQRGLPFVRRVGSDLVRDLDVVLEDITRIIHSYMDEKTKSFEQLPEQIQATERFEFIFAANFPDGYDRRTIEALQKIARNGPVAGKYLFIQQSKGRDLPKDLRWEDFGERWVFDLGQAIKPQLDGCVIKPLAGPLGAQSMVLELLAKAKPPETKIAWENLYDRDPATWWKEDSSDLVSAPVGASGRERKLIIWFGVSAGRPCAHGVLGAMPGSGKSNLYHVLICGLATRYRPDELNLYLIDGKVGVEFQPYRRLPHGRVVALHSAPELSRSVLEELIAEMKRRNELFKRHDVSDLPRYREKGAPAGKLARIVLMIDEYQELFEDDRLGHASAALLQLAQQGRSAGIHLLLGSQRFGAAGMLNQAAIFGSIHLRMAMKMSQNDVQALTEFGREGKRLVEQCDLPGKIVINDQSGDDKANEFGKVALLEPSERAGVLDALCEKADAEWSADERFATVVFDGQEQPNIAENPLIIDVLRRKTRPTEEQWRTIATASAYEGGFGVRDWFAGEQPVAFWFGQELNVHGQARAILRRRAMENVLLVGENQAAIYGMLAGLICSVPIGETPPGLRLWILDRAVPGTPWEHTIETAASAVLDPFGFQTQRSHDHRQLTPWLDEFCSELDRRSARAESELGTEPTWLLLVAGADRLPQLTRTQNKFGTSVDTAEGEKLKRVYRDGPALGLHVILSFPAAGPLKLCLDRPQLEQFKHRVVTQVSEADSFLLIGNDHGAKLQRGEAKPIFAIYQDAIGGVETKFKPYTADAQMPWSEQLRILGGHLQRWKEASHVDG